MRTPRFFLRRFKRGKRNPYYHATGYTAGGKLYATGSAPRYAKSKAALRDALEAEGLSVSNITPVLKSGASKRRARRRKHIKARRARKPSMSKTTKRSRARRMARSAFSGLIGRVFSRKVRGKRFSVKILGRRKGRGKKRKVLAVRWSGKKGSTIYRALSFGSKRRKGTHVIGFTNPRKRRARRSRTRRNPGIAADYIGGLTSAPTKVMSLFRGPSAVKNGLFAAGGAVGTFMLGGVLSAKVIRPLLEKVAPGFAARVSDPGTIEARVVGGLLPYTAAFGICKLAGKKLGSDVCSALMVGGAIASVVELIRPGMVGDLLKRAGLGALPGGDALAGLGALSGPVCGLGYSDALAGYVEAPSYAGTAGYVEAPSYAGTAGYVEAPSYAGTAGLGSEQLAGTFLDDAADKVLENNWLS